MLNTGAREELDRQAWFEQLRNNPSDELLSVVAGILVQEGYAFHAEHLVMFRGRRQLQDVGLMLGAYDASWRVFTDTLNFVALWWAGLDEDGMGLELWNYYTEKADEHMAVSVYIDGDLNSFFGSRHNMQPEDIRDRVSAWAELFTEEQVKKIVRRG